MSQPYNDPDQMLKMSEHPEGLLESSRAATYFACIASDYMLRVKHACT